MEAQWLRNELRVRASPMACEKEIANANPPHANKKLIQSFILRTDHALECVELGIVSGFKK
ncbi:hypothetical protein R6Q59_012834 [Mikania micrantha]